MGTNNLILLHLFVAEMKKAEKEKKAEKQPKVKPGGGATPAEKEMLGSPGDFYDLSIQPFNSHARRGTLLAYEEAETAAEQFIKAHVCPGYSLALHKAQGRHSAFLLLRVAELKPGETIMKALFAGWNASTKIRQLGDPAAMGNRDLEIADLTLSAQTLNIMVCYHHKHVGWDTVVSAFALTARKAGGELWESIEELLDTQIVMSAGVNTFAQRTKPLTLRSGGTSLEKTLGDDGFGIACFKVRKRGRLVGEPMADTIRRLESPDLCVVCVGKGQIYKNPKDVWPEKTAPAGPLNRGPYDDDKWGPQNEGTYVGSPWDYSLGDKGETHAGSALTASLAGAVHEEFPISGEAGIRDPVLSLDKKTFTRCVKYAGDDPEVKVDPALRSKDLDLRSNDLFPPFAILQDMYRLYEHWSQAGAGDKRCLFAAPGGPSPAQLWRRVDMECPDGHTRTVMVLPGLVMSLADWASKEGEQLRQIAFPAWEKDWAAKPAMLQPSLMQGRFDDWVVTPISTQCTMIDSETRIPQLPVPLRRGLFMGTDTSLDHISKCERRSCEVFPDLRELVGRQLGAPFSSIYSPYVQHGSSYGAACYAARRADPDPRCVNLRVRRKSMEWQRPEVQAAFFAKCKEDSEYADSVEASNVGPPTASDHLILRHWLLVDHAIERHFGEDARASYAARLRAYDAVIEGRTSTPGKGHVPPEARGPSEATGEPSYAAKAGNRTAKELRAAMRAAAQGPRPPRVTCRSPHLGLHGALARTLTWVVRDRLGGPSLRPTLLPLCIRLGSLRSVGRPPLSARRRGCPSQICSRLGFRGIRR